MLQNSVVAVVCVIFALPKLETLVYNPAEINCDFQTNMCYWRNIQGGNLIWSIQSSVVADPLHSIPQGVFGATDYFVMVSGRDVNTEVATLVRDHPEPIACQESSGVLGFFLWKTTPNSKLEICIRRPSGPTGNVTCIAEFIGYRGTEWFPVSVPIPSSSIPFEIILRGFVTQHVDSLALDKLVYDSDIICEKKTTAAPPIPKPSVPGVRRKPRLRSYVNEPLPVSSHEEEAPKFSPIQRFRTEDRSISIERNDVSAEDSRATIIFEPDRLEIRCDVMDCDFERNDTCDYEVVKLVPSGAGVEVQCGPLNDNGRTMKPPSGRCFLVSRAKSSNNIMQIIASKAVFTTVYTELKFWYYLPPDDSAQLMVCLNGLDNCIWKTSKPKRGLIRWWKQTLQIPRGRNQVYFVILQWKPRSKVGLDEIKLAQIRAPLEGAYCQVYEEDE